MDEERKGRAKKVKTKTERDNRQGLVSLQRRKVGYVLMVDSSSLTENSGSADLIGIIHGHLTDHGCQSICMTRIDSEWF